MVNEWCIDYSKLVIRYNGRQVLPLVLIYAQYGYFEDVSHKIDNHEIDV